MADGGPPMDDAVVMRLVCLADGRELPLGELIPGTEEMPAPEKPRYLMDFVDTEDGMGKFIVTAKLEHALRFANFAVAAAYWQQQSKYRPRRPDGKPNRPLTAFTVEFKRLDGRGPGATMKLGGGNG